MKPDRPEWALLALAAFCAASLASFPADAQRSRDSAKRAEAQPLTPSSFAHALTLDGPPGAVLSFPLPAAVYQGAERADLGDLCVFDANGTPAPFLIRTGEDENSVQLLSGPVTFFPWGRKDGPESEARPPSPLDIEINADGAIIRIRGQAAPRTEAAPAWLLDLSTLLEPPAPADSKGRRNAVLSRVLTLTLPDDIFYSSVISLQSSADLARWRPLGRQAVARIRHGDDFLEKKRISIQADADRYLLLEMEGDALPLAGVTGEISYSRQTPVPLQSVEVAGALSSDGRSVVYDLGASFPLVSATFDLPQTEIMSVRLYGQTELAPQSGARKEARRQSLAMCRDEAIYASGVIYNLPKGDAQLTNDPFSLSSQCRYWRLEASGDVPFVAPPAMRAYWRPKEALFLARGEGPWTLAYGRRDPVRVADLPLADLGRPQPAILLKADESAQPGPSTGAKTPAASPSSSGFQYVLWGVLGGVAILLAGIVFGLFRSLKKSGNDAS